MLVRRLALRLALNRQTQGVASSAQKPAVCGIAFAFCAHSRLPTGNQGPEAIDMAGLGATIMAVEPAMLVAGSTKT